MNNAAIASPTTTSGHAAPVSVTPSAASSTPAFAITSFREHSHTERMFRLSARWRHRAARTEALASSASRPTTDITPPCGVTPCRSLADTSTSTPAPNSAMMAPLRSAARVSQTDPRPITYRLKA
jgi:hypothetical protein